MTGPAGSAGGPLMPAARRGLRRWSLALLISTLFTLVTACSAPAERIGSHAAVSPQSQAAHGGGAPC
jgi:hypothetical protein